jgi:N-acetylmannosamine-6-phosphate 2-epimerase / N-acetylmannosamine kinase
MSSLEMQYPTLRGRLVVSCQTWDNDAFQESAFMARFARAAVMGGAAGIRADGPDEIRAIREAVSVPIIGIFKAKQDDGTILITPSFEGAKELVQAGANLVALDCTARGQRSGALERLRQIKAELGVPVLADIATVEEAIRAAQAGADAVLSTLRGYTTETAYVKAFDPAFIAELVRAVNVPVIAEGRIESPQQACQALDAGAYALVVGSAITRPARVTRRFVSALETWQRRHNLHRTFVGIDLGGTNTKVGLVNNRGDLLFHSAIPTPWKEGRDALLRHLKQAVSVCLDEAQGQGVKPEAIGLATAGWVDSNSGEVLYATENLPGWTGANPASYLREAFGLAVGIENDANALAVAEKHFGAANMASDFVCITLGTGVGGGCYIGGQLNRGRHCFANALGHVPIEIDGLPCTCGRSGCLEPYTNSAALLRYAPAGKFTSAEQVIAAANSGDAAAQEAIRKLAGYLAIGCASIVSLLDPELLIFGGGLVQDNPLLLRAFAEKLAERVTVWDQRKLRVQASALGYSAGVLGAAAIASAMPTCDSSAPGGSP